MLCLGVMAAGESTAASSCKVDYVTLNNWGSGAQQQVTVTNLGAAVNAWELTWTYKGTDAIYQMWNASYTQAGQKVSVKGTAGLATSAKADFGFLENNPGAIPTDFAVNGLPCNDQVVANSTSWLLDTTASSFYFVSVKNVNTAEPFTFTDFKGTVDKDGNAVLAVPLDTISTGVDVRNTRIRDMLFESSLLPVVYFNTKLDLVAMDAIPVGGQQNCATYRQRHFARCG